MLERVSPAEPGFGVAGPASPQPSSLRGRLARGTVVNGGFTVALAGLGLVENFVLARFVSRADYGLWGVLIVTLATIVSLKQVGVGDKFIQQNEPDQEAAFQIAFTAELTLSAALALIMLAVIPLLSVLYRDESLVAPGAVLAGTMLISSLEAPQWIFYKRMDFVTQRLLGAINPLVSAVVAIALAAAGAGYWAFVGGLAAGALASAVSSACVSPYRIRVRWHSAQLREYRRFAWPLLVANAGVLVMAWAALLVTKLSVGLAAVGVVTLSATLQAFTGSVDSFVTGTLYPAICAVADRTELLFESFVKTNRIALMWAVPFGVGLSLFAGDIVHYGIGERWHPIIPLLEVNGVVAAVNHVGFNWDAYLRARGRTRPIAVSAGVAAAAFLVVGVPAIVVLGIPGFAVGVAAQAAAALVMRVHYLHGLFRDFEILRQFRRAFIPSLPAGGAVLLARLLAPGDRTLLRALAELAGYALLTAAFTWWTERGLLLEMRRMLSGR